jgi:predicted dehydrogenase
VATPEWEHMGPSLEALQRGKHLLLEKPMTTSLADARRLAAAARASGTVFMLCHVLRFDPRFAVLREAVRSNAVGPIRRIHTRRDAGAEAFARVAGRFPLPFWLLPHDIDLVSWILDREPTQASARQIVRTDGTPAGLVADLMMGEEVSVSLESSWMHAALTGRPHLEEITVVGEAGRIEVRPVEQGVIAYSRQHGVMAPDAIYCPEVQGVLAGAFPDMVRHFLRCIRTGGQPVTGLREGLRTMAVAGALERSLAIGGPVLAGLGETWEQAPCRSSR